MRGLIEVLKALVTLFARNAASSQVETEKKETPTTPSNIIELLTLQDLITSSGKYPERANSKELTSEVLNNLHNLLMLINPFLTDLGLTKVKVSSGFRPAEVNAALSNSARKSLHMIGKAVDLEDASGALDALVESHDELKKKYGLWQESPGSTIGWCHIDTGTRSAREKNIFLP